MEVPTRVLYYEFSSQNFASVRLERANIGDRRMKQVSEGIPAGKGNEQNTVELLPNFSLVAKMRVAQMRRRRSSTHAGSVVTTTASVGGQSDEFGEE